MHHLAFIRLRVLRRGLPLVALALIDALSSAAHGAYGAHGGGIHNLLVNDAATV